jgi:hypothetical protein
VKVKRVAEEPGESGYGPSAQWTIDIAKHPIANLSNVFLRMKYVGDVARVYSDGHLVTDDFYSGLPLEIGLKSINPDLSAENLRLEILPLRKDAPIYIPPGTWPQFSASSQVSQLNEVQIVPEYEVTIEAAPQEAPGSFQPDAKR